ncbi:hypothetical protein R1sor_019608 [Riccia sorocarpa]|uniref:Uncharacterized protein n=1 Tax=Riccia sorocarpa TaxID=122646 RepID=A0ABD3IDM5_9MARC
MDACVQLSDANYRDIQLLPCESDGTAIVTSDFLVVRWKYVENLIFINKRTELLDREASLLVIPEKLGFWRLKGGRSYVVGGLPTVASAPRSGSVLKKFVLEDGASRIVSDWDDKVCDPDLVSGYEAVLQIEGSSKLSRLDLSNFEHRTVSLLPNAFDGNVIFELPPVSHEELAKKDEMFIGMDRSNDCWLWTKCITTSAQISGKKTNYSVNRIRCVGRLKGLTREENYDLLDSLSPMAAPETFTNLIRSIRKSSKEQREESYIISLHQRINFRYVLHSLFIGQAGPDQRPHVFKMSLDGP